MSNTSNLIAAFLGGAVVGGFITAVVMKRMGYKTSEQELAEKQQEKDIPKEGMDTPSYDPSATVNTHKTSYSDVFSKPDLEEISKKYKNSDFDKEMASHEHPEEDTGEDEPDEEEEYEIGEALTHHFSTDDLEMEEIDGFGHVICELTSESPATVVYLVHEEYCGEIYPVESLYYYEKDEVLCDINDAVVSNVSNIIGDALDNFGGVCGGDPNKVYVRNASMGFEYEITRINGYYAAKLYGVSDKEFEKSENTRSSDKKMRRKPKEDD